MTAPIAIRACVTPAEWTAVRQAAALLETALGEAWGHPAPVACVAQAHLETLGPPEGPEILVTSLLAEAEDLDTDWDALAARLCERYRRLAQRPDTLTFVCTIFRHVPADLDGAGPSPRRLLIRRLNLLAATLSQETGALVIDLDRALADVGARALQTDFRLGGARAAGFAAARIAGALLAYGLDEAAPYAVLERAAAALARLEPRWDQAAASVPAAPVGRAARQARWARSGEAAARVLVRQALRGQLPAGEIWRLARRAVARRGLGPSLRLILAGVAPTARAPRRPGA